jgi:hypothetical protein
MDPSVIAAGLRLVGQVASSPATPTSSGSGLVAPSVDASGVTFATGGSRATGSARGASATDAGAAQLLGGLGAYAPWIGLGLAAAVLIAVLRR